MRDIVIVGNGRDFHTVDWYRTVRQVNPQRKVWIATELVEGESQLRMLDSGDNIINLFNIDKYLFSYLSVISNLWRNFIKVLSLPMQIIRLRKIKDSLKDPIFHAHSMYYIFLCWAAKIQFIGSPMGSDVLVRPDESRIYRFFAKRSLISATSLTVDSEVLQKKIKQISSKDSYIFQNGIEAHLINKLSTGVKEKRKVLSIRGVDEIYQINKILESRNDSCPDKQLHFVYPFHDETYKQKIFIDLKANDKDLGRLEKNDLYKILSETLLAISIPYSDSSPRSVYEAIFSGCCVAVTDLDWVHEMPLLMQSRCLKVNLNNQNWLSDAIREAEKIVATPFKPSQEIYEIYDQESSMKKLSERIYC